MSAAMLNRNQKFGITNPSDHNYGVNTDEYAGPGGFVAGSKETTMAGGSGQVAFKSSEVSKHAGGFASLGAWNRGQTVNFDTMNSNAAPHVHPVEPVDSGQ